LVGALGATWQWAVELAQVQAGIVSYGRDTLATAVQGHLWSLVTQVTAVGLRLGLSELASSVILSACMTALAVQALSLTIFLFARNERYALLGGLAVVLARAATYGATYPIDLLPAPHSLGAIGQSFSVLIPPLMALGYVPAAAFMAGLGLAVHPPTGLWALARRDRRVCRRTRAADTGNRAGARDRSRDLHRELRRPSIVETAVAAGAWRSGRLVHTRLHRVVDLHRQPVRWMSAGVWFNVAAVVLAALLWTRTDRSARLLLGLSSCRASRPCWLRASARSRLRRCPCGFLVAIPGRFLNFDIVLLAPLLVGVMPTIARAWRPFSAAPLVFFGALAISDKSPLMRHLSTWLGGWPGFPQASILAVASVFAALAVAATIRRPMDGDPKTSTRSVSLTWASLAAGAICVGGAIGIFHPQRSFGRVSESIRLRGDEQAVFEAASRTRGSLLTQATCG
jgi:hypothetical protein